MVIIDPARLELIRVVHADDGFVVIDKPAGVLSVPGRLAANHPCAASWCRQHFPAASGPITVHRLDLETSGLLLMALNADAHARLSRQFEAREVEKRYTAVVAGCVENDHGRIDAPMRADISRRPLQVIDHQQGRPASTEYRVLARDAGPPARTRLEMTPLTGRTHQLRLHCLHIGHAILGDALYGEASAAPRLLLHAYRLVFSHPVTGQRVAVECPPPF